MDVYKFCIHMYGDYCIFTHAITKKHNDIFDMSIGNRDLYSL